MAVSTPYRAIRTPQLGGVLTDRAITAAKSMEKAYKIADGNGLYLLITPAGSKLWRWKYRSGGKEKLMAVGSYPI